MFGFACLGYFCGGFERGAFEVGEGQAAAVGAMMSEALRAREIIIRKDLGRVDRVVAAVLGIGER